MFWKIYFWFFMALSLTGFSLKGVAGIWGIVDAAATLVALAGVFLFAYRQVFLNPLFWKACFFLFLIWEIFHNTVVRPANTDLFAPATLLGFLFVVPSFFALYAYGFRFLEEGVEVAE